MRKFYAILAEVHRFHNQKGKVMSNTGDWQGRHLKAWCTPTAQERVVGDMIHNWAKYGEEYYSRYESPIGDDGVLGVDWARIGRSLRGLLNGECGRFDCGTLNKLILTIADEHGVYGEL